MKPWEDEDTKLLEQIVRQADVIAKDAQRQPYRGTIKQRAEGIAHVARLVLERRDKR
jgi:hypothetical protein